MDGVCEEVTGRPEGPRLELYEESNAMGLGPWRGLEENLGPLLNPEVIFTIVFSISGVFGVCPPSAVVVVGGGAREQFKETLEPRPFILEIYIFIFLIKILIIYKK